MILEGKVGPVVAADGSDVQLRFDKTGALMVSQAHAPYQEAVARGNVYSAMSQTGCVWSVGLTAIYTGVLVSNPNGSGKVLSILAAGFSERVQPAGIQDVSLAGNFSTTEVTHSVPGVPVNLQVGNSNIGTGKWDTGATMPVAPKYLLPLIGGKVSALLSVAASISLVNIGGLIQLLPGAYCCIAAFTVGAAVGQMGAIVWEELNL